MASFLKKKHQNGARQIRGWIPAECPRGRHSNENSTQTASDRILRLRFRGIKILPVLFLPGRKAVAPGLDIFEHRLVALGRG